MFQKEKAGKASRKRSFSEMNYNVNGKEQSCRLRILDEDNLNIPRNGKTLESSSHKETKVRDNDIS